MSSKNTTRLTPKVVQKTSFFGDFNDQPIPSTYSNITNDYDNNGNQIDAALTHNKVVEDSVGPNDDNNDENSFASDIDPPPLPQTIFCKLKEWTEWVMKPKKVKLKE